MSPGRQNGPLLRTTAPDLDWKAPWRPSLFFGVWESSTLSTAWLLCSWSRGPVGLVRQILILLWGFSYRLPLSAPTWVPCGPHCRLPSAWRISPPRSWNDTTSRRWKSGREGKVQGRGDRYSPRGGCCWEGATNFHPGRTTTVHIFCLAARWTMVPNLEFRK